MTREKQRAGQVQTGEARGAVERRIQQHAVDDEPHEERLDHFQARRAKGEDRSRHDRKPMRPQPAEIIAHILAAFYAAQGASGRRRWLVARGSGRLPGLPLLLAFVVWLIQPPLAVGLNELGSRLREERG